MKDILKRMPDHSCVMVEMSDRKPEEVMKIMADNHFTLAETSGADHLFIKS